MKFLLAQCPVLKYLIYFKFRNFRQLQSIIMTEFHRQLSDKAFPG